MGRAAAAKKIQHAQKESPGSAFRKRDPKINDLVPNAEIRRSVEEAWKLVMEHTDIVIPSVRYFHLARFIPFEDAKQYVILHMFKAALVWDSGGMPYESFAFGRCRGVWNEIARKEMTIKFCSHFLRLISDYKRWRKNNPDASIEKYAETSGVDPKLLSAVAIFAERGTVGNAVSLDEKRGPPSFNSTSYSPVQAHLERLQIEGAIDRQPQDAVSLLMEHELSKVVNEEISTITCPEYLERYYGMNGREEESLESIGGAVGLSREWVRQTIKKARRQLAEQPRMRELGGMD